MAIKAGIESALELAAKMTKHEFSYSALNMKDDEDVLVDSDQLAEASNNKQVKQTLLEASEDAFNHSHLPPATPTKAKFKLFGQWELEGFALVAFSIVIVSLSITAILVLDIIFGTPQLVSRGFVVSSTHICTQHALSIVKLGGSAVDVAIATALCSCITTGYKTGLSGGGVMLVHNQTALGDGGVVPTTLFDYTPSAPNKMNDSLIFKSPAKGVNVSVPGFIPGIWKAHQKFGNIKWSQLFDPAIQLAKDGFQIEYKQRKWLTDSAQNLSIPSELLSLYLTQDGLDFHPVGTLIKQSKLVPILEELANLKSIDEYENSQFVREFLEVVSRNNGTLSSKDIASYEVDTDTYIAGSYAGFSLVTAGLPSLGGASLLSLLHALEAFDHSIESPLLQKHRYIETVKLIYTQLSSLLESTTGDSSQIIKKLMYSNLSQRIKSAVKSDGVIGTNAADYSQTLQLDVNFQFLSQLTTISRTSDYVLVEDKNGLFVTMTNTLGGVFGAGIASNSGVIINNYMSYFSSPDVLNSLGQQKRPLSFLTPTVIFNSQHKCGPRFVVSSEATLRSFVGIGQVIISVLEPWRTCSSYNIELCNFDIATAVNSPQVDVSLTSTSNNTFKFVVVYENDLPQDIINGLKKLGHELQPSFKGLYSISSVGFQGMMPAEGIDNRTEDSQIIY